MTRIRLLFEAPMPEQLVPQRTAEALDRGIIVAILRATEAENHALSGR